MSDRPRLDQASQRLTFGDFPLLSALVAGEAVGEPDTGKLAVAHVALNRERYTRLGLTMQWSTVLTKVILQPKQFSCFDDPHRWPDMERAAVRAGMPGSGIGDPTDAIDACVRAAWRALTGADPDPTLGADHYFNPSIVLPSWAAAMTRTVRIGRHDFYRSVGEA